MRATTRSNGNAATTTKGKHRCRPATAAELAEELAGDLEDLGRLLRDAPPAEGAGYCLIVLCDLRRRVGRLVKRIEDSGS
jgi:hypothetical protein